jgi:hypothetical protein
MVKAFVYLPWRFIRFQKKNWEWLMADFCYFNTYLSVIGCLAAFIRITTGYESFMHRYNFELLRGGFAFANGALALAVPLFGNKIVFHDVDNLASVFIHTSPALLFWALLWGGGHGTSLIEETWPTMFEVCPNMQEGDAAFSSLRNMLWYTGSCEGTVLQFVVYPAVCWLIVWGIPYYVVVLCLLKDYLVRNNKESLYTFTVQDKEGTGKLVTKLPEYLWPVGYMLQHFLFTFTTGFLSIIMWNSFIIHTLFLFAIILQALHNGSTFMFRVVAARHVQEKVSSVAGNSDITYELLGKDT